MVLENKNNRPLSPHIQIYKLQVSSALSILHRITGTVLYLGVLFIIWWIICEAYFPNCAEAIVKAIKSIPGLIILFGWTAALYYHSFNGIRHLFWDIGKGFSIQAMNRSAVLVIVLTTLFTVFSWYFAIK